MARVKIEDCLVNIDNCFELSVLAAHRAKQLYSGVLPEIPQNNERGSVLALREIAERAVAVEDLRRSLLKDFRRHVEHKDDAVMEETV